MTDLKRVLRQLHKNLNTLEELKAKQAGDTSLRLLNEIDDHHEAISLVEQAIAGEITQVELDEALKSLNIDHSLLKPAGPIHPQVLRNRQVMLKMVNDFWVKGVLENSLHHEILIELGMAEKREAVTYPWETVIQSPGQSNRKLPPGAKMTDVFNTLGQSLLILGEPGSGKTTMLLALTRELIAQAEQDPAQPMPVVFNLSSWSDPKQPIAAWVVKELTIRYNIPQKVAQAWVDHDELLLLLDGLDEVALACREACVQAINAFCQEHLLPLVVCCRSADYEALTTRLNLRGAILLQPLTPRQVDEYLERGGQELATIRQTLRHDAILQELTQSPLMLSIMVLAYQGISTDGLSSLDTLETRRSHLFDTYIRRMFERRGAPKPYSFTQTVKWLSWLAGQMKQHEQSIFLIEFLQKSGLKTKRQQQVYSVIVGLILTGRLGDIKPIEKLNWSWRRTKGTLIIGLVVGLIGGLIGGLGAGVFFGLIFVLIDGLIKPDIVPLEMRTRPNQGIQKSIENMLIVGLIVGLIGGLGAGVFFGLIGELMGGLKVGLIGLIFGLGAGVFLGGGEPIIKHFILRFLFWRNGDMPWHIARFFDFCAERIFLRKVGGGYIFIHRLLLEHFASLEPEQ